MNSSSIALSALILSLVSVVGIAQHSHDNVTQIHSDSDAYIRMLEDPKRDSYQKPDEVIKALEIGQGETIADIGAGSGYFTFRLSRAVGESGKVFAVDINPDMIRYMNRRARDLGVRNVNTVLADPDDPLLTEASVDRILIVNTWHHIENRQEYLKLMKRALRPGGTVVMVDYQKRELPVGPPVSMKIDRPDLVSEMDAAGFKVRKEFDFLPYQYFLVFALE